VVIALLPHSSVAQTTLPDVNVTVPKWEERHGGYVISSNFEVDTHMSAVIYPAEPFQTDDILSVRLTQLKDDEYFVLQECISTDCAQAHILRERSAPRHYVIIARAKAFTSHDRSRRRQQESPRRQDRRCRGGDRASAASL